MSTAAERLCKLRHPSDIDGEQDILRNWGFTVYRTVYTPSSSQQWQQLLETIQTKAYEKVLQDTDSDENDPAFQHLWSLFRLDARSDPKLSSLAFEELRQLCITNVGGPPMNTTLRSHRLFLVVDEEVLSGIEGCIVKCVDADYLAEEHVSCNPRCPQRYFGWFKAKADAVVELWKALEMFAIETVAPETIGGAHLVVWEEGGL